jgi:large-conductance mechanosensitive channel
MLKGFRNFLMRGDVVVVAVGLVVALAFSNLVKAFTDDIINPLIAAAQGSAQVRSWAGSWSATAAAARTSTSARSFPRSSTSSSSWPSCTS